MRDITEADYLWFVCSKGCIITGWCIKQLSEYVSWIIRDSSCSFPLCIRMLLMVEKCIRGEYFMLYIDMWKLIINTWKIITKILKGTEMQIIYMDRKCHKSCLKMVLSGLKIHKNKFHKKLQLKILMNFVLKSMFNVLKITSSSQWFHIFTWNNKNWEIWKICSQFAW